MTLPRQAGFHQAQPGYFAGVQPSDAIRELARVTLHEETLPSLMDKVAALTKRVVTGADEVSVTVVEGGRPTTVAFTGDLAMALDERQYEGGRGPCLDGIAAGQPVRIVSMRTEDRWSDWVEHALSQGCRSSMSLPMPLQREISAALNIYSRKEDAFDEAAVSLGLAFAAHAGVTLANMHLYDAQARVVEQLQTAMQSRAVIEQAKGIVMGDRRCTAEEAFDTLVRLSQESNRKLRDVAQALVHQAGGWTARSMEPESVSPPA